MANHFQWMVFYWYYSNRMEFLLPGRRLLKDQPSYVTGEMYDDIEDGLKKEHQTSMVTIWRIESAR